MQTHLTISRQQSDLTDDILVRQAHVGDQDAFEILVDRYSSLLYLLISRLVSDKHLAYDILQHVSLMAVIEINIGREGASGSDYAVCYIDPQRGVFSNTVWKAWFASDTASTLEGGDHSTITFFGPCVQFPYTTHYTVIASDGQVHEYTTTAEAIQGFQTLPTREVSSRSQAQMVFPQFCYYHEVTCPSGVYRIEFSELTWTSEDIRLRRQQDWGLSSRK